MSAHGVGPFEEEIFHGIEIKAKLRAAPARVVRRKRGIVQYPNTDDDSTNDEDEGEGDHDDSDREDVAVEVDHWESDLEDDECDDEPLVDGDEGNTHEDLEEEFAHAEWEDVQHLDTDPRAVENAMPENILPAFLMPAFRDETLLNWFLWYMPLTLISDIAFATNEAAKRIPWAQDNRWRNLRAGELLQWIGIWILMTVYPINSGGRRNYWRGMLKFGKYMKERRFESILRAFTLPQYKKDDPEWGGPARLYYTAQRYDKFQETRRFTDVMRKRFQTALKPGGWLCIDESMFSWLGRALKCPGWKVIKRKPHPIGLEAKTTACSVTGVLIDFEFQEGTIPMGSFAYVDDHNRSTAWVLRLTKPWHNKEQRTVIADAAFAQVRVAVALKRLAGLFFIGNVKTCTRFFARRT